jgi:thiosulfate sulfurtransferase
MAYQRIATDDAFKLITDIGAEGTLVVDIRDEDAYMAGHIESAQHIHNNNLQEFINDADFDKPLFVCCYHGNMSQGAAAYFAEQGFEQTYSIDGGFEAWQQLSG